MIKRVVKKIPTRQQLIESKSLKLIRPLLHFHYLWAWNRRNVARALFVGMICAFTPWPFQMLQAAFTSVYLRANVPIAVASVWITNPLTMPPIFYFSYLVGAWTLDFEMQPIQFELTWTWLETVLIEIWQPFLLGCAICGLFFGSISWLLVHGIWRYCAIKRWKKRNSRSTLAPPKKD